MRSLPLLARVRACLTRIPAFHLQMAFASAVILVFSIVGCLLTSVQIPGIAGLVIPVVVAVAAVFPLPLYWHEKGKIELRDAALTIPWALLLTEILPIPVAVAGRLGMRISLRDTYLAHLDQLFGVSVPAIVIWASHHWLGKMANETYGYLSPMIPISFLLPALTGKYKHAQQFLAANVLAFALGIPLFALIPAVGPWIGYHLAANPAQTACQLGLFQLRRPGPYVYHLEGVVCFPSFHVIWAILCGKALWGFRLFRVPVAILSGLIILSTMTSAWHYFVDVLAGCFVAIVAITAAEALPG